VTSNNAGEALRTCYSGFPIATLRLQRFYKAYDTKKNRVDGVRRTKAKTTATWGKET